MAVMHSIRCPPGFLLELFSDVFIMSAEVSYSTVQRAGEHLPSKRSQIG